MTSLSLDDGATCVNAGGGFNLNECTVSDLILWRRRSQCCEWERLCTVDCEGLKSPLTHVENSHFVLASLGCRLIYETQPS